MPHPRLTVPTHVIALGPEGLLDLHGAAGRGGAAATRVITMSVVAGAGHSPHRDKPEATIAEFLKVIGG